MSVTLRPPGTTPKQHRKKRGTNKTTYSFIFFIPPLFLTFFLSFHLFLLLAKAHVLVRVMWSTVKFPKSQTHRFSICTPLSYLGICFIEQWIKKKTLQGNNNIPRLCHVSSHSWSQDCLNSWPPWSVETISWVLDIFNVYNPMNPQSRGRECLSVTYQPLLLRLFASSVW